LEIAWQILSGPEHGQQVGARTIAWPTTNRKGKAETRRADTSQSRVDERRSSEARAVPLVGTPCREFHSRLRVSSQLYSPQS
jgi:hypothetical protein